MLELVQVVGGCFGLCYYVSVGHIMLDTMFSIFKELDACLSAVCFSLMVAGTLGKAKAA